MGSRFNFVIICLIMMLTTDALGQSDCLNLQIYQKSSKYPWNSDSISQWFLNEKEDPLERGKKRGRGNEFLSVKGFKFQKILQGDGLLAKNKGESPSAILVLVHGLNNKPKTMDIIAELFLTQKIWVLRVALAGHRGSQAEGFNVTSQVWIKEMADHICAAKVVAKKYQVPLYGVGFSLGGLLLGYHALNAQKEKEFEKLILISPAIKVPWYSKWTRWLHNLGDFRLFSANHPNYRSLDGTTAQQYKALGDIQERFSKILNYTGPTQVRAFLNLNDQVVDSSGVIGRIDDDLKPNWSYRLIKNAKGRIENFNHMFLDEATMGRPAWVELQKKMMAFINSNNSEN